MKQTTLVADQSDIRLDKYLADKIDDISRSLLQKYIKNGNVKVNGETKKANYLININDAIEVNIPENGSNELLAEPQNIELNIIFEDEDLIAINKPAGLTVHPGVGNREGTLANALAYHFKELSDINGPLRPGIIHRLDQDTSGIILIAKNNTAHMKLAEQFTNRKVKKVYFGITWGQWKEKDGSINEPISRKRTDPTTFQVNASGKESSTNFKIIKETEYFSEVEYYPKTGRTHQIRVHSAYAGHPILGDEKYGGGKNKIKGYIPEITKKMDNLFNNISRHMLHAKMITFTHPKSNESMIIKAELPDDIKNIQKQIELLNV